MNVFYLNRHATCPHYIANNPVGFSVVELSKEAQLSFNPAFSTIVFVCEGDVKLSGPDFASVTVPAGKMFVIPSKVEHQVEAISDSRLLRLYIIGQHLDFCTRIISEKRMAELANRPDSVLTIYPLDMLDTVKTIVNQMVVYTNDKLLCCDIHTLKQRELSAVMQAYYDGEELKRFLAPLYRANSSFYEKVMALKDSYLNIDQMAERLYMSRSTFIRNFIQQFNEPPIVWMTKVRTNALYKALRDTEKPLEEVSQMLKFSSQQSMNTYCKKNLGGTPTAVRSGKVTLTSVQE